MLFSALALLPFLPLLLAAPSPKAYNPFPPIDPVSYLSHGRSGFSPELLAAYRTPEVSTSPAERGMQVGRHYKRGASLLEVRGVGQGRRSKVRVIKRAAAQCRPVTSSLSASSTATSMSAAPTANATSTTPASKTSFKPITPPAMTPSAVVVPSSGPINPSAGATTSAVEPANPTNAPSPWGPEPMPSSSSSLKSSLSASTAAPTSLTSPSPSSSSSTTSSTSSSTSSSTAAPTVAPTLPPSVSSTTAAVPTSAPVARLTKDPSGRDGPFSGWGTWFDVGLGACGVWDTPDHPLVALSAELMNSWPGYDGSNPNNFPMCNKHIQITWRGITTIARVADQCPGCAVRSLDMSKGLFEHFASLDVGLLGMDSYTGNITWSWVAGEGALPSLPYTP